jgi:hypothetical protein
MHISNLKLATTPEAVIKQARDQADRVPLYVCANSVSGMCARVWFPSAEG